MAAAPAARRENRRRLPFIWANNGERGKKLKTTYRAGTLPNDGEPPYINSVLIELQVIHLKSGALRIGPLRSFSRAIPGPLRDPIPGTAVTQGFQGVGFRSEDLPRSAVRGSISGDSYLKAYSDICSV